MDYKNISSVIRPSPFCVTSNASIVITIALYCILLLVSLIGNCLIVAVFFMNKTLRTTTNYLMLNMAVSDLLIPTIALPWLISVTYLSNVWLVGGTLGEILCKVVCMAPSVSLVVSTLSMTVIAVDRFHGIFFAMKPALISIQMRRRILVAIWIIAVAFRAHFLYGYRLVRKGENNLMCAFQWHPLSYQTKAHYITWITMFSLNIASALVLSVLYGSIVFMLNRQQRNVVVQSEVVRRRAMENRQITFMLITVVVLFFMIWAPYHVYTFLSFLNPEYVRRSCTFLWMAYNFPLLYTITNPFIYYIFNKKYRKGFQRILCSPCAQCKNVCPSSASILHNESHLEFQLTNFTSSRISRSSRSSRILRNLLND